MTAEQPQYFLGKEAKGIIPSLKDRVGFEFTARVLNVLLESALSLREKGCHLPIYALERDMTIVPAIVTGVATGWPVQTIFTICLFLRPKMSDLRASSRIPAVALFQRTKAGGGFLASRPLGEVLTLTGFLTGCQDFLDNRQKPT